MNDMKQFIISFFDAFWEWKLVSFFSLKASQQWDLEASWLKVIETIFETTHLYNSLPEPEPVQALNGNPFPVQAPLPLPEQVGEPVYQ